MPRFDKPSRHKAAPTPNQAEASFGVSNPSRMKTWQIFLAMLLGGGFCWAGAEAASIEGKVTLPKARTAPVMNQRYEIVSKGGVIATNPPVGVVYLDGEFPPKTDLPLARMEQKDLVFVPQLLAVQTGTRVEFPNLDDTFHPIFFLLQGPSDSIWGAIAVTRNRCRAWCSTSRG